MAKTKISEFSTTPGNNTDINGINISEGCAPSGINNAIRELMSDLKEWQSGAMDVYVIPQGTAAAPGIQLYGDLDTGLYGYAANQLGVAVGGASAGYFSSDGWVGNVVATTVDLTNIEVTNIKAKDGTTSISLADSTGIATFSKATVIETTDNTNAALRITQLGTGNALLVEDATNPDTTPTVIDQFGNVILGTTARTTPVTSKIEIHGTASELSGLSPSLGFYHWSATASLSSTLTFRHYPSGTVGTLAANTLGDVLGRIVFLSYDGTNAFSAVIRGVSGAGGTTPSITYDASGGHNFTSGPIDVENLEVTNIKARDGTAAASIADSTGAITVTKDLTANGVTLGKGLGSVLTNTALGRSALAANTVGDLNTAVGNLSLTNNTGGTGNTAVGHVAMTSHQGGSLNTAVGAGSLTANLNGNNNTAIGQSALGTATGSNNTAVGSAAGSLITNGNKNTIIGNYDGNQGGLDIRTASNYIVLSDGDGNPRAYWNGANATFGGTLTATTITGTQVNSDNLRLDGNTLSSTDTNGNIVVAPNGTGITTFSNYLKTGNLEVGQAALGTNLIKATNTNGGIYLQTNGTGLIFADAASIIAGNASATTKITTNGASDLVLDTNDGSNSGSITIQDGVNGNIVIAPNGTGQVQLSGALDVTDIEVTNIKAKDGTAALSIADSTGAVTVATALTANGGAVFNENGADVDFRVEGDTDANLIFADASTDRVGIGTSSPAYKLDVTGSANITSFLRVGATPATGGDIRLPNTGIIAGRNAANSSNRVMLQLDSSDRVLLQEGSVVIDSSGNLGIGVTPSGWGSGFKAIDIGPGSALSNLNSGTDTVLTSNSYRTSTNWVYKNSQEAGYYRQASGTHSWFTAPSGTANTTTITSGVSYTIITSGNQTAFGAANNNVGTSFTANASGTLSSGTVSQNISFTQAMTLDASGNLGVGVTSVSSSQSASAKVIGICDPINANLSSLRLSSGATFSSGTRMEVFATGAYNAIWGETNHALAFATNNTERARITSGGYFKASNNGTYGDSTALHHELVTSNADDIARIRNTHASTPYGIDIFFSGSAPDNNTQYFLLCRDNAGGSTNRCFIYSDGDLANHDGVYGTISDQKLKQDIVDASSQWNDIKAIRFRKYRMKSDVAVNPDAPALLGVIAQELEQVSPGLVDEHPDMETVEVTDENGNVTQTQQPTGTTTKTVKSSILLMKAAVALQEAMARIEKLEAEVAALKGV